MSRFIKVIFALSLICALALTFARRHYVKAPERTQAEFAQLIADIKPALKTKRGWNISPKVIVTPNAPNTDYHSENDPDKKLERLNEAKAEFMAFDPRFTSLNTAHLRPCQRDEFYRYKASLKFWQVWAEREIKLTTSPDDKLAAYEAEAQKYTGRPVSFAEIKAVGEAEFMAVQAQLKILAAHVRSDFDQTLDQYALREDNFSTRSTDITARMAPLLAKTEAALKGEFDFAHVPPGVIQTKEGFGPNYAIASYHKRNNTMVIYYADGRYNHIYDTMLVVHEIMPGHHLQLKMNKTRACGQGPISSRTFFTEGWASYAEFVADKRGLFDAADQRLGWLDYRLLRAMRIRLDTSRVEDGLSEEQARQLWQVNMPARLHDDFAREWARVNLSRHHLSYIFGSQAILAAHATLKEELGMAFSERDFHAALLNSPHQTLDFLAERIKAQMHARKGFALDTQLPDAAAL